MVHAACDDDYARQVTAEHRVATREGVLKWVPKTSRADNHYLDAEVYAFAVADAMGLRNLGVDDEQTVDGGDDDGRHLGDDNS